MVKDLSTLSVQYIKGVGPKRAALLQKLGIGSAMDILYYLPFRYEDRRNFRKIRDLEINPQKLSLFPGHVNSPGLQTVSGRVISKNMFKLRGKRTIFELAITDGSGMLRAKWFNQPFLDKRFNEGDEVVLSGVVKPSHDGIAMENPEYEVLADDGQGPDWACKPLTHTGRIVPIYRATGSLTSRQIRAITHEVIESHIGDISDPVPEEIIKRTGLPGLRDALRECHFPDGLGFGEGRRRLAFDELFLLELGLSLIKKGRTKRKGIGHRAKGELIRKLRLRLPFRLTPAQEKALEETLDDMKSPYPMNRLLHGDVGSGKTVVALMSMLFSVESGYQAALMAPTEILAEQHYLNMKKTIETLGLRAALLTANAKERPLGDISSGGIDIVIGTHALLGGRVKFSRLGLIVIDEQHRFGVRQRAALRKKGADPDVLVMTATPIPRTLSMTLYGDLDRSVIGSPPPGRTPVETLLKGPENKKEVYSMMAEEMRAGGQVYVVYPVIEGDENSALKSAMLGAEALRKIFPKINVSLVHGKMRPEDREKEMADFKSGIIDILVSTTVIEVGVDVPNASLMVIAHAERFGLAQLHQLRGRVGRGRRRSRCVLLAYGPLGEEAGRRLRVMTETTDGFRIAEEDLAIRGPGELMGTRQSGLPDLRVADIIKDSALLEAAAKEADSLVEKDHALDGYPLLRGGLQGFWKGKIEIFKTA